LYARKVLRQDPACASARAIADAAVALREEKTAHRKAEEEQEEFQRENERERREWMARGKELFNRGNFLQAREVFQKVLQQDPGREEALNLLACCLAEMGEVDRAQEIFARLSSESAEAGLFLMNWARALLRNGRPLPAAEKFAQAAAKGDKYHCALFEAGQIYFQAGTYERAVSIFAQYVEKNPASYETWGKMGASYLAQGKLSSAKEAYFVALKICPDYEPARRGLKRIEELEKQGRTLSVSPEIR